MTSFNLRPLLLPEQQKGPSLCPGKPLTGGDEILDARLEPPCPDVPDYGRLKFVPIKVFPTRIPASTSCESNKQIQSLRSMSCAYFGCIDR